MHAKLAVIIAGSECCNSQKNLATCVNVLPTTLVAPAENLVGCACVRVWQINFGINDNQPSFETIASIVYHDIVHDIGPTFLFQQWD